MTTPTPPPAPITYATRSTRVPKPPLTRLRLFSILSLTFLGLACLLLVAFVPLSTESSPTPPALTQVRILRPAAVQTLHVLLLAGFLLPLIASLLLLTRRRMLLGILLLIATFPATLLSFGVSAVGNLAPWTLCDTITRPDGSQYAFLDTSFLMGQTMALARVTAAGPFYQTFELLGTNNGDSPRSYLLVVRPDPFRPVDYGALYDAPNDLLVGLRSNNQCYLAYDLTTNAFYGHDDIEKLSPYLLLTPTDTLHTPDESEIIRALRTPNIMGAPTIHSLEQSLTHPNPAVRASAASLLKIPRPTP